MALELDVRTTTVIVKRDGKVVPFDPRKIESAIYRCLTRASVLDAIIDGENEEAYYATTPNPYRDYQFGSATVSGRRFGKTSGARALAAAQKEAADLTGKVVRVVAARGDSATVEQVQDIVEFVLQSEERYADAKHYILYRAEHERARRERPVPDEVRA